MNKILLAGIAAMLAFATVSAAAERPATKGAEAGVWTQDYDAAVALAKEKDLPIMMNFTGSDWCYWCKEIDKKVFSTDRWKEYAKGLVLVYVDFPSDDSLVPEGFVNRNRELADKFKVQGFPTFVFLDPETGDKIGETGFADNPEDFIKAIKSRALAEYSAVRRMKGGSPELKAEYDRLVADKMAIQEEFAAWKATGPARSEENHRKLRDFSERLNKAEEAIDKFFEKQ